MPLTFTCAKKYQCLDDCRNWHAFSLRLRHTFTFRSQVRADGVCCRCFAGDIQVFEKTPEVTSIDLSDTKCTGNHLASSIFRIDHLVAAVIAFAKKYQCLETPRNWHAFSLRLRNTFTFDESVLTIFAVDALQVTFECSRTRQK